MYEGLNEIFQILMNEIILTCHYIIQGCSSIERLFNHILITVRTKKKKRNSEQIVENNLFSSRLSQHSLVEYELNTFVYFSVLDMFL